jgi:hypothetical protein
MAASPINTVAQSMYAQYSPQGYVDPNPSYHPDQYLNQQMPADNYGYQYPAVPPRSYNDFYNADPYAYGYTAPQDNSAPAYDATYQNNFYNNAFNRMDRRPVKDGKAKPKKVIDQSKFKTVLCQHFMKDKTCPFGEKCVYAHGEKELVRKPPVEKQIRP